MVERTHLLTVGLFSHNVYYVKLALFSITVYVSLFDIVYYYAASLGVPARTKLNRAGGILPAA